MSQRVQSMSLTHCPFHFGCQLISQPKGSVRHYLLSYHQHFIDLFKLNYIINLSLFYGNFALLLQITVSCADLSLIITLSFGHSQEVKKLFKCAKNFLRIHSAKKKYKWSFQKDAVHAQNNIRCSPILPCRQLCMLCIHHSSWAFLIKSVMEELHNDRQRSWQQYQVVWTVTVIHSRLYRNCSIYCILYTFSSYQDCDRYHPHL